MQIQNSCKCNTEAQVGSQVAQSFKTGSQGQSQMENTGLWTGSQSKWSYYYKKRGWDENGNVEAPTSPEQLLTQLQRERKPCLNTT